MSWRKIADELKTDPVLAKLEDSQVRAVLDVLLLVMQADDTVGFMEEAELEHLIDELPWHAEKDEALRAHIESSRGRLESIEDDAGYRAVAEEAAKELTDADVRRKAYDMAVTLAEADMEMHPDEHKVLTWVAEVFEIPESERKSSI